MRQDEPDFFVLGSMKSGTTWLAESINYHPDFLCFIEILVMTDIRDAILQALTNSNNFTEKTHKQLLHEFDFYDHSFDWDDLYDVLKVLWRNMIYRAPKDAKFYGEKSPNYLDVIEEIYQVYPNAKYVHIVRDPRDVALSYYEHTQRQKRTETDPFNQPDYFWREQDSIMMDHIMTWKKQQSAVERMKQRFPQSFLTVRYEDMSAHTIKKVIEFIGGNASIEWAQTVMNITNVNTRPKAEDSFFRFGKSGNWKDLNEHLISYMNVSLGQWLETYKYK